MKTFRVAVLAALSSVAFAGCASLNSVDYTPQIAQTCTAANSTVAALTLVQSKLSAKDQQALATIGPLVTTYCAEAPTETVYESLLGLIPQLAVILVDQNPAPVSGS